MGGKGSVRGLTEGEAETAMQIETRAAQEIASIAAPTQRGLVAV